MGDKSGIEWTDATWNPVTGCTKVSQGCKNCYAESVADRFFAKQYPKIAFQNSQSRLDYRPRQFTDVVCHPDRLEQPLHWKKPRRIFVNSMSDLFHEDVPIDFIDKVFAVMALCPQHTFQILTKRPERMREYCDGLTGRAGGTRLAATIARQFAGEHTPFSQNLIAALKHDGDSCLPFRNVQLGVSVEDQKTADERIPRLLQTSAAVRFVSYEPALSAVDFTNIKCVGAGFLDALSGRLHETNSAGDGLDWLIAGGESGPAARPSHPDWFRSVRDQCQAAGVAFFFKQWGEWAPSIVVSEDLAEQSNAPYNEQRDLWRVGKKAAGRLLDGREWNEYPEVRR